MSEYRVVQFGDGHWEAQVNGQSLYHYDDHGWGGDFERAEPNRYSTAELALAALEWCKKEDAWRRQLLEQDTKNREVTKIIDVT